MYPSSRSRQEPYYGFNEVESYDWPAPVAHSTSEGWSGYSGGEESSSSSFGVDTTSASTMIGNNNFSTIDDIAVEEGLYYECNRFIPAIRGAPVSAIACNLDGLPAQEMSESSSIPKLLYVASHSTSLWPSTPIPRRSVIKPFSTNRGAILATHCLPSDTCYSAVVAHREAHNDIIIQATSALTSTQSSAFTLTRNPYHNRPTYTNARSYQPPFGPSFTNLSGLNSPPKGQQFQLGIRSILPLPSCFFKADQDYLVTASPSGVRMHTVGGLLVQDKVIPGMGCATVTPAYDRSPTHITVGAFAIDSNGTSQVKNNNTIVCLDLHAHLKTVIKVPIGMSAVTCMETNHPRNVIVAGLQDGMLKVVDGSLRDWKTCMTTRVKGHAGGVACIAVSPDGNTIATTGLLSSTTAIDVFPDSHVLLYDLRIFGRGGLPHRFTGAGGGPRFLSFLDDRTLLVASGQPAGGMQIMPTFLEDSQYQSQYIQLQYSSNNEERATALHVDAERIITVGTSHSQVIQLTVTDLFMHPDMELPACPPAPSGIELEPRQLHQSRSFESGDIFGHCVLLYDPLLSSIPSFGNVGQRTFLPAPNRMLHSTLHKEVNLGSNDFLTTLPAKTLGLHELLQPKHQHEPPTNHDKGGKHQTDDKLQRNNPNQLLFNNEAFKLAYADGAATKKVTEQITPKIDEMTCDGENETRESIPVSYRRAVRPAGSPSFNYSTHNDTLLYPGWDCNERNLYIAPVLTLLYYIPEYRRAFRRDEFQKRILEDVVAATKIKPLSIFYEKGELLAELDFLFHQIGMLSKHALAHPTPSVGVFSPKNFLATFSQMPEAAALNLFDSSPDSSSEALVAALELNKRVETFYRFLIHHLDSELGYTSSVVGDNPSTSVEQCKKSNASQSRQTLIDSVQGMKVSITNIFPFPAIPTVNQTRALVLPLNYDDCSSDSTDLSFRKVMLSSLYMETNLKAYSNSSKTYENVIQRRMVSTLPKLLALSASGAKKSDATARLWDHKNQRGGRWLPSQIELEIVPEQKIVVRELSEGMESSGRASYEWVESERILHSPEYESSSDDIQKLRYKLFGVVSFIRALNGSSQRSKVDGHYVIHLCIPKATSSEILKEQIEAVERCISSDLPVLTLASQVTAETLGQRAQAAKERVAGFDTDQWVLFNGFLVTWSSDDDARDFEKTFKEPCLIVYRAVEENVADNPVFESNGTDLVKETIQSISNDLILDGGTGVPLSMGDLVAIDSEFVLVSHAKSVLSDDGSRITSAEGRYALARLSLYDCRSSRIFMDDYVMPKEKVVDFLTRFSGIRPEDFESSTSRHNLVAMRTAYVKLRVLVQRGCIFVGHGLDKDLEIINMFIPPYQIIDTVTIWRKENSRFISLRFLANYLLGRDMQQDTHDSVEDAKIAYEIYIIALRLVAQGRFNRVLDEIYDYGRKTEWRLGVDDRDGL